MAAKSVTHRLSPETEARLRAAYGREWFALERAAWAKYVVTTRRDHPEFWLKMTRTYLETSYEFGLSFVDLQADYDPTYVFQADPKLLGPVPDVEQGPVEDLCDVPDPWRDA